MTDEENSPAHPQIELLELCDGIARFRARRKFDQGSHLELELDGIPTRLNVIEALADNIYQAEVLTGRTDLGKQNLEGHKARRWERLGHRMRIMSPALPGFQALSLDFSPLGLRVQTDGPVQAGKVFEIQVDFDWPGLEPLSVDVRTVWCNQHADHHEVGVEFQNPSSFVKNVLQAFYGELSSQPDVSLAKLVSRRVEVSEETQVKPNLSGQTVLEFEGVLAGYRADDNLLVLVIEAQTTQREFHFKETSYFVDRRGQVGNRVERLTKLSGSPQVQRARGHQPISLAQPSKAPEHYQFLNGAGLAVSEVVALSLECCTASQS